MPEPPSIPRTWLRSYPPGVPETYRYPLVPLTRFLDDAAQDFPETSACEFEGAELSYAQLLDHTDRFAATLQSLGYRPGDRVALVLPNCPQHLIALFAVLRIGGVVVEIDPAEDPVELGRLLADAEPRAVIFADPVYEALERLRGRLPSVEHYIRTGVQDYLPFARRLLFPLRGRRRGLYARIPAGEGVLRFTDLVKRSEPVLVQVPIDPAEDVAAIVYTRGRGGERKGAMLTHLNLVANAFQIRLWIPDVQAGRERLLAGVPLSSVWGLTGCIGLGTLSGATFVLTPELRPAAVLRAADDGGPSLLVAPSHAFGALLDHPQMAKHDLSRLRVCLAVGDPLPPASAAQFEAQTGARVREVYGLTEAGPFTHGNPVYATPKAGSIGLPISDTVCLVVDRHEPTRPLEPGQPGELAIYGPQVMRGYWRRASATTMALKDGWLLTGDIVEVDADGYFHLVDQKRDVIDVRGREVSPRDVESVLLRHPKVAKAAAAGIPDFPGGDLLKAYVVLKPGETATTAEIDEFCRAELAPHQVPKRYEFRAFLPQTPPGKPMRDALVAEELGNAGLEDVGG